MESLGEWRFSGVLLHLPFVKRAIPEKLVPQSELICRRLFRLNGVQLLVWGIAIRWRCGNLSSLPQQVLYRIF